VNLGGGGSDIVRFSLVKSLFEGIRLETDREHVWNLHMLKEEVVQHQFLIHIENNPGRLASMKKTDLHIVCHDPFL
jgi:hypothetical protein